MFNLYSSGSSFSPLQLSGCVYRMKPTSNAVTLNGSRVLTVDDSSGTGDANKDATQAVAGKQPLYNEGDSDFAGQPSIELDESRGDCLQTGTWSTQMPATCTWFVVARITGIDSGNISFLLDGLNAARAPIYVQSPNLIRAGGTPLSTTGWGVPHTVAIVFVAGASGKLYVSDTIAAATGNSTPSVQTGLTIGAGQGLPAGFYFDGKVAEVCGWDRALGAAEVTQLLNYSRGYGLVIDGSVMPLGDSITLGSNGPPGGWRKILFDAHPRYFVGNGAFDDPSDYWHNGVPSETLASWNVNLAAYWAQARCRELWVTLGTNDIHNDMIDATTALNRLDTLLTTAEGLTNPPQVIRVASITPLTGGFASIVDSYNAGMPAVVAAHPTAVFANVGGRLSPVYLDVDNIHPNADGHTQLAQFWAEALGLAA